ncbi:hypothetical protein DFH08DRAFT_826366 [Mycena albidolilacea]|uniref:Uncharacterized protein n=1 Tax=Mycena albidolilacea TaxID=1033008 RepID=A0AAD7E8I4_9AGAR|nr:hypothetical protein DFH08DRAFT_826366 [Mycena albidolilacea]
MPTGFTESADKKKILCMICERNGCGEWIVRDGDKKHLGSKNHGRNVEASNIRVASQAAIQNQNALIDATLQRLDIPLAGKKPHLAEHVPSAEEQKMWDQYQTDGATFTAGHDPAVEDEAQEADLVRQAEQFGRWNATSIARNLGFMGPETEIPILGENDEEDALLCEMLDNAQLRDPPTIEDMVDIEMEGQSRVKSTAEWYPYPTKMMFLLDTLDNLPRQRISNSLMKVFLWILREGGARDVPSLDALRKIQLNLHNQGGVPTVSWTSTQGNVFHLNDIRKIVAKDYANPLTRSLLHFYPEIPDGPVCEAWHAHKWRREVDRDVLTPMIVDGHRHFYVNELARLRNGSFVIPLCWVIFKGEMHADAIRVTVDGNRTARVEDTTEIMVRARDLLDNYLDLKFKKSLPTAWDEPSSKAGYPSNMPNPLRQLAKGRPLYTSFVDLFFDDVSGNRSKSWNKHYNCYCTHRNLPRRILQQEFHTHFVTTSPHASSSEQFEGIKAHIESTHTDPIAVYDQSTEQEAAVRVFVNTGPSDNPMGSEMTAHIGAKGNYFCRKCKVGGCGEHKRTDAGFHSMFEEGAPRSAAETLEELHKQVELACLGVKAPVEARQTDTGVKDAYTNYWINDLLRRSRELKKSDPTLDSAVVVQQLMDWVTANESMIYNPFLSLKGFDVSKDTPIEILHTILLGIVKYAWHSTHTSWNAAKKTSYTLRLQAANTVGLSIPSIRANYIMQFANSLIGRQFKQVAQTCVFQMHDLIDGLQFAAWKAMGELLPLLWYPEIDNMDEYLVNNSLASTRLCSTADGIEQVDVETAYSNVLDIFAMLDPTKILAKNKLHILTHTKADIRRHGPLLGVQTESYECYNAVFRFCSILSNHLAPSRDIAHQLAHQEGLKHRLTGGWWFSPRTGSWECSGWAVRDFLSKRPILQALLGWTSPKQLEQGSVELTPLKRIKGQPTPSRPDFTLEQTDAKVAMNIGSYTMDTTWQRCKTVVSKSRDECPLLSWVYVICPVTNTPTLGRIHDIFTSTNGSVVILDVFRILSERHSIWNLPKLARRQGEQTLLIVPSTNDQNVQFIFNVQHDCYSAKCVASGSRAKKQERVDSNVNEAFIEHQPLEEHVINTTAFHNAHLLRRCLPRSAWAPVLMFTSEDRLAKHNELAEQLRGKHSSQKAAKAAAAAAAKAAVSTEGETAVTSDGSQADAAAAAAGNSEVPGATVDTAAASSESSIAGGPVAAEAAAFSSVVPTKRKRGQPKKGATKPAAPRTKKSTGAPRGRPRKRPRNDEEIQKEEEPTGMAANSGSSDEGSGSEAPVDVDSSDETATSEEEEYIARPTRRPRGQAAVV